MSRNPPTLAAAKTPRLVTPASGPGYTPNKWASGLSYAYTAAEAPVRNSNQTQTYDGQELRTNPGIPPERMLAYSLPSRVGNRLHYPGGRVEVVA